MSEEVRVELACGCTVRVPIDAPDPAPRCATHDERRVRRVTAPPPRIRAVGCDATGPLVRKES